MPMTLPNSASAVQSAPMPADFSNAGRLRAASPRLRSRVRRASHDASLLYLIGLTLPFPQMGPPLNEYYVLSVTSLLGLAFGLRRFMRQGLQPLHRVAALLLLVFAATAMTRHPISSYLLSLGALGLALLPLTTPSANAVETRALLRGLKMGIVLTLALMVVTILVQVTGLQGALGPVAKLLVGDEQTGYFLDYIRPFAGFSEPSHLAIYLASMYVMFDLLSQAGQRNRGWRWTLAAALLFTGSVSGLLVLVSYLVVKALGTFRALVVGRLSSKFVLRGLAAVLAVTLAVAVLGPSPADFVEEYGVRLLKTLDDIETGNLVGSEASRANAVLALPDFWDQAGLAGFVVGTGYANYQGWLIDNYGHLNESATFSRGSVDNIMIGVFLATGAVGFAAYLLFLYRAFSHRVLAANLALLTFVVGINFSYGYLIASLYWNLLFVLALFARQTARTTTGKPGPSLRAKRRLPRVPTAARA